jgi:hypothetical protein
MRHEQENFVNMSTAIDNMLTEDTGVVSGMPALQLAHHKLTSTIAALKGYLAIEGTVSRGLSVNKFDIKIDMILRTMKVVDGLTEFALAKNDITLFSAVNYSKLKLHKMRDDEIDSVCSLVNYKACTIGEPALAQHGLAPGDLTSQSESIGIFVAAKNVPNDIEEVNQYAENRIEETITNLKMILYSIERLIRSYTDSKQEFVEKYYHLREVYDMGVSHNPSPYM